MTVVLSVGTAHAFAADPYVVYTANKQVDGAVILRSEPATGSTVEISRNGPLGTLFHEPYDLAVEADGGVVVADMGVPNQKDGAVIRVDPVTGRQSLVASGGNFYDPAGIAIGPDGMLYVLDNLAGPSSGAVIKVNPTTGVQQLVASNFTLDPTKLFDLPFGIAVRPNGQIIVVNRSLTGALPVPCLSGTGRVFAVDPVTFVQSNISNGGRLAYPLGVAIDKDGSLVVANECGGLSADGLVRITGGTQEHITTNNSDDVLETPERVGIDPAGNLLVTDYSTGPDGDGGIVKVNPSTGEQSALTTDSLFNHPLGIAVIPNRPPTAALAIAPRMVAAGRSVTLDASGSRDPEGLRLVYEWDLDGDGTFEAGSGTTPTAMPKFAGDGIKTVRVRVDDPHGGRAVAQGTVDVDGSKPVLTSLRARARVLGLPPIRAHRRARASRRQPPGSTTISFRLSEAATVTLWIDRARKGRRPKGSKACSTRAKRGRHCTALSRARTIKKSARPGENGISVRARGLKPGSYRVVLTATDQVGNRSPKRAIGLRVVRLR